MKGRSGRRPKPTAIKVLEGNPGKRPLKLDKEPMPQSAIPDCPPELLEPARREYERIAPELARLGLLAQIDRSALAAYAIAYGRVVEAEAQIKRQVEMGRNPLLTMNGDKIVPLPLLRISERSMELMYRYLCEFGMSPSSRARVQAKDIDERAAELPEDEAFFKRPILKVVT